LGSLLQVDLCLSRVSVLLFVFCLSFFIAFVDSVPFDCLIYVFGSLLLLLCLFAHSNLLCYRLGYACGSSFLLWCLLGGFSGLFSLCSVVLFTRLVFFPCLVSIFMFLLFLLIWVACFLTLYILMFSQLASGCSFSIFLLFVVARALGSLYWYGRSFFSDDVLSLLSPLLSVWFWNHVRLGWLLGCFFLPHNNTRGNNQVNSCLRFHAFFLIVICSYLIVSRK